MNFARTQFLSLVTKAVTTALGIVQSVIIVRILSPSEFGLVGLVMSIGGVIGVSQNLGIVDGAIREIAVLTGKKEIGKVFWVSHLTRQLVTVPLSLLLIVGAPYIGGTFYHHPEIIPFIQLYAAVLILQGLQDVLGATLTGMKNFAWLYIVQIVTAAFNIGAFAFLTKSYGVLGFFWAVIITTSVMVVWFSGLVLRDLKGHLGGFTMADIKQYGRRVLRIGLYMYISRIFFVIWQRLPLLLLGATLGANELGFFNVSLTFGSKLTIIAMALSEVNLSWLSSLFASEKHEFAKVVTKTMHRVVVLMAILTFVLLFFAPEIVRYIIGAQYAPAEHMILIITAGFFLYSLTDIATSSLFVSGDKPKLRAVVFGGMTAITAIAMVVLLHYKADAILSAWFVFAGALFAFIGTIYLAKKQFNIWLVTWPLGSILLALFGSMIWLMFNPPLVERIFIFILFVIILAWETHRSELLPPWLRVWLPSLKNQPSTQSDEAEHLKFICFAGAQFDQPSWTNRQHMTSRISQHYPVLYVEPRVWIVRHLWRNWSNPRAIASYFKRLFWYEQKGPQLFIKSQWNLIPMSREIKFIGAFNHYLNSLLVSTAARHLGFTTSKTCLWIYDTEAAQFLAVFPTAKVIYDCVDNHAAQGGVDRNPARVREEEAHIISRASLVTVTSHNLYEAKQRQNGNTHLLLNAGDVALYQQLPTAAQKKAAEQDLESIPRPRIGFVGALDSYKIDIALLAEAAKARPDWQFVFIGAAVVDRDQKDLQALWELPNMHTLGARERHAVPAYVEYFDVCIVPYRNNSYNAASFPLKFWEFMASGKPIVVTGLPELQEYEGLIGYANNGSEFIARIEDWLRQPDAKADERIALARQHSWESRARELLKLIVQTV